jgi:hypothetical protein
LFLLYADDLKLFYNIRSEQDCVRIQNDLCRVVSWRESNGLELNISPINREFYLAKGTEKFILGRYLLSGILLILLSLRPWGVAVRPAILESRGAKSHFCDYFIIRARYLYLSYYRKCRACNSLHFLLFMFFCQKCDFPPLFFSMAGRAATPQGRKLGNINNMPDRRYLPSINFSAPFARWSHFYVSIDWTISPSAK